MRQLTGDLVQLAHEGRFDVIVHGCNCRHRMGAGIALQLAKAFPEVVKADLATPRGAEKLGTLSYAAVWRGHELIVGNAYTQDGWGRGVRVDYGALSRAFQQVARDFSGARFGYPRVGAGLAGGDWGLIAGLIERAMAGQDHTLVTL